MSKESLKIVKKYSKQDFLRKVWIQMAREDAPLEVFEQDFSDVSQKQYCMCYSEASFNSEWGAMIGKNREEWYIDIETYYEKIPYTDYVKEYNSDTKKYETVPVTKYREEERQRQVKKKKTVTDWVFSNGVHSDKVSFNGCVDGEAGIDLDRYFGECNNIEGERLTILSEEELESNPRMQITQDIVDFAYQHHLPLMEEKIIKSLPGDKFDGFNYKITEYNQTRINLVEVPEFFTKITYNGKDYGKKAFPFGTMRIVGSQIPNPSSIATIKAQKERAVENEIFKREKKLKEDLWNATYKKTLLSLGCLVASMIISLWVRVLLLVVLGFVGSAVMFYLSMRHFKATKQTLQEPVNQQNAYDRKKCKKECQDYELCRKQEILIALNKKLASLGLEPANEHEYSTK